MKAYREKAGIALLCFVGFFMLTGSGKNQQETKSAAKSGGVRPSGVLSIGFTDITASSGINTHAEGPHGSFFADVNNDGLVDLYITTYDKTNSWDKYYINTTVGSAISFVSTASVVTDYDGGSHGACWADLDNDGDYDLVNGGTVHDKTAPEPWDPEPNAIYENTGVAGGYAFIDHTPSEMLDADMIKTTRAVTAFDMDNNGLLDIFCVAGFRGTEDDDRGHPNEVYQNEGSWDFSKITTGHLYNAPAGQGCTDSDYDDDGDIDMFAANRSGPVNVLNNDGTGVLTLVNSIDHGITYTASDGITLGDIDNDGDLDLIATEVAEDTYTYPKATTLRIYYNKTYHETSPVVGKFAFTGIDWENTDGYMGVFGDIDNDGDLDLMVAGYDTVFINVNGAYDEHDFLKIGTDNTITDMLDPRSMAFADIDNDGDLDFIMQDKDPDNGDTYLYRNDLVSTNHYLKVKLVSPYGQAGAFGSKVYVTEKNHAGMYAKRQGGLPQVGLREARGSNGYLCQNDPVLHFGLGALDSVDVAVEFLGGYRATRIGVAADQTLMINTPDVRVAVKVFLEGPYDTTGDTMKTDLNNNGYLPTDSPYDGRVLPKGVPSDSIVDWVNIQLRETAGGPAVASKSALLRNDGMVVADDGVTEYITMYAPRGDTVDYYIVVDHRNHLKIMSATSESLDYTSTVTYDFTDNLNKYYGNNAKQIETSVWGMISGDANANGQIQADDKENEWRSQVGLNGYRSADFNLNGNVQADDKENFWRLNVGLGSSVP